MNFLLAKNDIDNCLCPPKKIFFPLNVLISNLSNFFQPQGIPATKPACSPPTSTSSTTTTNHKPLTTTSNNNNNNQEFTSSTIFRSEATSKDDSVRPCNMKGSVHSENESSYFLASAQTKLMQPFLVSCKKTLVQWGS